MLSLEKNARLAANLYVLSDPLFLSLKKNKTTRTTISKCFWSFFIV